MGLESMEEMCSNNKLIAVDGLASTTSNPVRC